MYYLYLLPVINISYIKYAKISLMVFSVSEKNWLALILDGYINFSFTSLIKGKEKFLQGNIQPDLKSKRTIAKGN